MNNLTLPPGVYIYEGLKLIIQSDSESVVTSETVPVVISDSEHASDIAFAYKHCEASQ